VVDVQNNPNPNQNNQAPVPQAGSVAKEVERPVSSYVNESVTSETQPQVEQELKDIGVEARTDKIELDKTHERIGIAHAPVDTPVNTDSIGTVQLPMTEEEAQGVMKQYENKVTYDIGEHGEHDAYVVPSKLGLATLVDKINKFLDFFRIRKRQTT